MKFGLTQILAIWGAVLSTISICWNVLKDFRDRPRLKLNALVHRTIEDSYGQIHAVIKGTSRPKGKPRGHVFTLDITNIAHRSIMIAAWGSIPRKGEKALVTIIPVKVLVEGEVHTINHYAPIPSIVTDSVQAVFVEDSRGKKWYLPRKELVSLRSQVSEIEADQAKLDAPHTR